MKKIFLFLIFVSLLSSVSYAIDLQDGLVAYFNLTNEEDSSSSPLVCVNTDVQFTTGLIGTGGDFDGTDYITCNDNAKVDLTVMTLNFWANFSTINDAEYVLPKTDGSNGFAFQIRSSAVTECSSNFCLCAIKGGIERECLDSIHVVSGSKLSFYTVTLNSTTVKFYINNSLIETDTFSNTGAISINTEPLRVGGDASGNAITGMLDEVSLYNKIINDTVIEELYNSGNGCNPIENSAGCEPITPQASLILFTNLTNNTINVNDDYLTFNYSGVFENHNTTLVNITFVLNGVENETLNNVNLTNQNIFNISLQSLSLNYTIFLNASNFQVNDTYGIIIYRVDTIIPNISTNFTNNSNYDLNSRVNFSAIISDLNLLAINGSILDTNLDTLDNEFYDNLTVTELRLNLSRVFSIIGTYYFDVTAWDSHHLHGEKLKYKASLENNNVKYNGVKFYCDDIKKMNFRQEDFKIIPIPEFNKASKSFNCYYELENSNDFLYLGNRHGYNNHYVSLSKGLWIDETDILTYTEKISNNKIKFNYVFNDLKNTFETNSIGDLNINNLRYSFTISEPSTSSTSVNLTGLENQIRNFNSHVNLFLWILLFIVTIIIFIFIQMRIIKNYSVEVLTLVIFVILNIKFIAINEILIGWICTAGWLITLIDTVNEEL